MTALKNYFFAISLLVFCSVPALASVTVNTPVNGATVAQQFTLSAAASICNGQPVASMGFSLDNNSNVSIVMSQSINATMTATAGTHTLRIKAWGNAGASCRSNIAITVTTSGITGNITVSSPLNGATVTSPFSLGASASSCASQSVTAMGYSLDDSTSTATGQSNSIAASVIATAGVHLLHVKAWGNAGAVCVKDVSFTASAPASNPKLSVNSTNIAFGSVSTNTTATQTVTLTSTGTAAVTISSISIAGTGFTFSGASLPMTLNPSQSAAVYAMFNPKSAGSATGQLTITSNSTTGSTTVISLTGTGQAISHEVDLNWLAPPSSPVPVAGYLVFRADNGSSTYQQISGSVITQTAFVDSNVLSGQSYVYVVKSVDSSNNQSLPSNTISALIP